MIRRISDFGGPLAVGALVSLACVQPALAQDEWVQQVRRILQQSGTVFEDRGYAMTHQIYTGALNQGAVDTVSLDLNIGTTYQIMGACDTDCSDLDATLLDPSGNQVDSDVELDDVPIVSVTPSRSGTYRVQVTMATCSSEPCRYGVAVFGM